MIEGLNEIIEDFERTEDVKEIIILGENGGCRRIAFEDDE